MHKTFILLAISFLSISTGFSQAQVTLSYSSRGQDYFAIAVYIGPPETTKQHGEDLKRMLHSLQPVIQH